MGLRVQLGHNGARCIYPKEGHKDFTVIHTNGLHYVGVAFCNCDDRFPMRQQLLRLQWFPATVHYPQTCATFSVLRQFHIITLTGKLSAYEYYRALEHLTDNTSVCVPKVSICYFSLCDTYTYVFLPDAFQVVHAHGPRISPS